MKCDGTGAETRFRLSAKRTSPFTSAGASVQSTTGSRGVRISGRNAGYTMFRDSVKSTGYPLHSPVTPSLHVPCVNVSTHFNWSIPEGAAGESFDFRSFLLVEFSLTLNFSTCNSARSDFLLDLL